MARSMGRQKTPNLQKRYGKRNMMEAAFFPPGRTPLLQREAFEDAYGKGAVRKVTREGGVAVPLMTPGELGRGAGRQDKLREAARKMQKRTLLEQLTGK